MINEMSEQTLGDDSRVLQALQFWPLDMRTQHGRKPLPDLIRPAFRMLDRNVTLQQALVATDLDETSAKFLAFSRMYIVQLPVEKLQLQRRDRQNGEEVFVKDPRTSEMVNHMLSETNWVEEARTEQRVRKEEDVKRVGGVEKKDPNTKGAQIRHIAAQLEAAKKVQEPFRHQVEVQIPHLEEDTGDCESQETSTTLSDVKLDMFLPMLFEHPTKSAAWKVRIQTSRSLLLV